MSLASRVDALAAAVGAEIKDVRADLGGGSTTVTLTEAAAPATPPAGKVVLYSVDGNALLVKNDAGVVSTLTGTGTPVSGLTAATTLTGTELVPVVQGGATKKTTVADIRTTDINKAVSATQSVSTTTGSAITDFTSALAAGTYRIQAALVWRSTNVGTGAGFFVNCSGGTVTRCVGHVYTTTTGTTATTGVADQATVAATFQMIEARAWRANNTNPGAFGGVDTANSDQLAFLECVVIVTVATSLQIVLFSETAATNVSIEPGSTMTVVKSA
jgi:hypothetical protein